MPTEPELPNIMDPNLDQISKEHPIDVRFQGYLPQFNNNSKPSTEIRPPDKQMYNGKQKLLENIKDVNISKNICQNKLNLINTWKNSKRKS